MVQIEPCIHKKHVCRHNYNEQPLKRVVKMQIYKWRKLEMKMNKE